MKKIIIGIHGLKNKPPRKILESWWKKSILEGFQNHGLPKLDFQFELVYWADLEYSKSLDPKVTDPKDPLFIEHPYAHIHSHESSEKDFGRPQYVAGHPFL